MKITIEMTASVAAAKQTKSKLAGNIVAAPPWSAALPEASLRALAILACTAAFKAEKRRMPGICIYRVRKVQVTVERAYVGLGEISPLKKVVSSGVAFENAEIEIERGP